MFRYNIISLRKEKRTTCRIFYFSPACEPDPRSANIANLCFFNDLLSEACTGVWKHLNMAASRKETVRVKSNCLEWKLTK